MTLICSIYSQWVSHCVCESFACYQYWLLSLSFSGSVFESVNCFLAMIQKTLVFSRPLFESLNHSVTTRIHLLLIQQGSVWIIKSFGHDWDSIQLPSADKCVNQWTIWSWLRFVLLVFNGSVFESVNHLLLTKIRFSCFQWVSLWISELFSF